MENILNYYYQLNIIDIKKKDYYYLLTTDEYEQYIFNEIIDSNELKEVSTSGFSIRLRDVDFSYVEELGYELSRSKEYKTNKHIFLYKRK